MGNKKKSVGSESKITEEKVLKNGNSAENNQDESLYDKLFAKRREKLHDIDKMKEIVFGDKVPFAVKESYKVIRTNLQYVLTPINGKVICVSSSNQGERKSTFAVNLALAFAENEAKVLLIDADMRKPVYHKLFEIDNSMGLSRMLGGFVEPKEAVFENICERLDVIPAGPLPPNPSELLAGKKMSEFLEAAKEKYDYIIIDTPPIGVVTDAAVVGKKAAGVILVACCGRVTKRQFQSSVQALQIAGVKILGSVCTGTDSGKKKYSRYSSYGNYGNYSY